MPDQLRHSTLPSCVDAGAGGSGLSRLATPTATAPPPTTARLVPPAISAVRLEIMKAPAPLVRGVFAPRHEPYQGLEIVRRARRALAAGGHGVEALDGAVEQHLFALLPAHVPGLAIVHARRAGVGDGVAGLAGRFVQPGQPHIGGHDLEGLLLGRRRRDGRTAGGKGQCSGDGADALCVVRDAAREPLLTMTNVFVTY